MVRISVFEVLGEAMNLVSVSGPTLQERAAQAEQKVEACLGKPEHDDLQESLAAQLHRYGEEDDSGRSRKWSRRCHNGYGHGPRFSRAVIRDCEVRRQRLGQRWLRQNFDWFRSWGPPRPQPIDFDRLKGVDKQELWQIDSSMEAVDQRNEAWRYEWLARSYQNWIEKKRRAA